MYTQLDEVTQYIQDYLVANQISLGLASIFYGDNDNISGWPCAIVDPVNTQRTRYATGKQLLIVFTIHVYIGHAKLSQTHSQRTKADIQLVGSVFNLLNADTTLGGNIIDGYVTNEEPIVGQLTGLQRGYVVGTRMTWEGQSRG